MIKKAAAPNVAELVVCDKHGRVLRSVVVVLSEAKHNTHYSIDLDAVNVPFTVTITRADKFR